MKKTIYAGTYTKNTSEGIYRFEYDDGLLLNPQLFAKVSNPKYLTKYEDKVIAVIDFEKGAGLALFDRNGKILDTLNFESCTSCYVTVKDNIVYTANYHAGSFSKVEILSDTFRLIKTVTIKEKAGCHQILLYKDLILVPCLFLDRIRIYNQNLEWVTDIDFPQGSGPRHGIFSKDERYLYLVSELSNELFVIDMEQFKIIHSISVLENNEKNTAGTAAIRMGTDEKHLYVSTRGKDVISLIEFDGKRIKLIETINCGGKHPRDFIIINHHLLSANMETDNVTCFKIKKDGRIGDLISEISIPEVIALISDSI